MPESWAKVRETLKRNFLSELVKVAIGSMILVLCVQTDVL